jgi:hypothetical protein
MPRMLPNANDFRRGENTIAAFLGPIEQKV